MKIDDMDKKILNLLLEDSRLSMREIAKRIHLSAPSVTERVRKLENEGYIQGYTIQLDYAKLGYTVECFVEVTLRYGDYEKFRDFIAEYDTAEFCYRIAGKACYIVKLRLKQLSDIEHFINSITLFAGTVTHIVLSKYETKNNFLQ
ncbi:Lrp/AsnC family transcriptional regulator [Bacillus smithii]|uniref:Lrp/AsnC family transcriptional regulator n=1 Tax=Bacillus smithii TaxID=1479 RepID=UPI002E1F7FF2|nr:Lrp/AsnC family transcriptional regulator [Bacillus smithii]